MRVETHDRKRKLSHVGPPCKNRSSPLQSADHRCILGRGRGVIEGFATRERGLACDVEHILDRDRNARDRRRRLAGLAQRVLGPGRSPGLFSPDLDEGSLSFARRISNPRQAFVGE